MDEQLRKAIEEATKIQSGLQTNIGTDRIKNYVPEDEHDASQAKLLRVIEVLVQQRDDWISTNILADPFVQDEESTIKNYVEADDAELIAALEGK